ncbi:hypothetical protein [Alteromonas sp. W364]|uniref:glycine-rich domain-containing protein n=1 Tax=Alteromonas sp. W364 TaxID=3075610 RepID=UPI0028841894|nr:hypothetical protein [Alteromonas sp. W364]MDT0628050.1 hypothetical protein [Alteromonas sp. W364]
MNTSQNENMPNSSANKDIHPLKTIKDAIEFDKYEPFPLQIKQLNFDKLKWKLTKSIEASWSEELCNLAEIEYKKFLSLKLIYPKISFVPNKLVDKFWHEHILDTASYMNDCQSVFGFFLHHYPYFGIYGEEDQSNLQDAFEQSVKIYEKHFGKYPEHQLLTGDLKTAMRCQDHACHVASECACRVEGACK